MTAFPRIDDVVAHLRAEGREAMALAVERLEQSLADCRETNDRNFHAAQALRAKYEPAVYRYQSNKPPPEASG